MPPPPAGAYRRILHPAQRSMACRGNTGTSNWCAYAAASRIPGYWRHAMRRVISVYLPRWPSDRLRRKSRNALARDKPLVTALMQGSRRVLASIDDAAEGLGLRCGMTVTHAQSLVPELHVVNA